MDIEAAREELERLLKRQGGDPGLAFWDDPDEEDPVHGYVANALSLALTLLLAGNRDLASQWTWTAIQAHDRLV